jgi:DNA polymerase-3 subunit epsilon
MKLNLSKDAVVLDLETTGLSPAKDKIIQIAILKIYAGNSKEPELKTRYINPGIPIPKKVIEITGITDEIVKDAPKFEKIAKGIVAFIGDADIITFNGNRFDIPFLIEELNRCEIELDMSERKCVDVKRLYHRMEPRDLRAAHRKFVGREIENAHDAGSDVQATLNVLEAMLDEYRGVDCINPDDTTIASPIVNDMDTLHEFTKNFGELDYEGWVVKNEEGKIVFGKGKYQDQELAPILIQDKGYYDWIMNKGDFTRDTRKKIGLIISNYIEETKNEK